MLLLSCRIQISPSQAVFISCFLSCLVPETCILATSGWWYEGDLGYHPPAPHTNNQQSQHHVWTEKIMRTNNLIQYFTVYRKRQKVGHPVVVQIIRMRIYKLQAGATWILSQEQREMFIMETSRKRRKIYNKRQRNIFLYHKKKCLIILFYVQTLNKYYSSLLTHLPRLRLCTRMITCSRHRA